MKVVRIITVVGIVCCALAISASASVIIVFEEDFETYTNGENIIGQNGWYGWEDPATPVIASPVGLSPNMSARFDPSGPLWQNLSNDVVVDSSMGPQAVLTYKSYYPANTSGLLWTAFGDWKVQLSQKTGIHGLPPGTFYLGDDSGTGVPGSGLFIPDTWGEIGIVIDWASDTAVWTYNGIVFSTRTDFVEESYATLDFLTTPASWGDGLTGPAYIDDITIKIVPEPSTLALFGLAGLALAH